MREINGVRTYSVNDVFVTDFSSDKYVLKGAWRGDRLYAYAFLMNLNGRGHAYSGYPVLVKNSRFIDEREFVLICGGNEAHAKHFTFCYNRVTEREKMSSSKYCKAGQIKCGCLSAGDNEVCAATDIAIFIAEMDLCPFPKLQKPLGVNLAVYEALEEIKAVEQNAKEAGFAAEDLDDDEENFIPKKPTKPTKPKDVDGGLEIIRALQEAGFTNDEAHKGRDCFHCSKHGIVKTITVDSKKDGEVMFCGECFGEIMLATCKVVTPVKIMTMREATDSKLVDSDMKATSECSESIFIVDRRTDAPSDAGDDVSVTRRASQAFDVD